MQENLNSRSARLRFAREARNLTQDQLAKAAGVSQATIATLETTDNRRSTRLPDIARVLRVPTDLLALGPGDELARFVQNGVAGLSSAASDTRKIPVLNYKQASTPKQTVEAYMAGELMPELPIDFDTGRHTFALTVEGESMFPEFLAGDRVVIDPELTKPRAGDYVLAIVNNQETTFRKYRPRGFSDAKGELYELVPLSSDFASVSSDHAKIQIVGTMVEVRRRRRV